MSVEKDCPECEASVLNAATLKGLLIGGSFERSRLLAGLQDILLSVAILVGVWGGLLAVQAIGLRAEDLSVKVIYGCFFAMMLLQYFLWMKGMGKLPFVAMRQYRDLNFFPAMRGVSARRCARDTFVCFVLTAVLIGVASAAEYWGAYLLVPLGLVFFYGLYCRVVSVYMGSRLMAYLERVTGRPTRVRAWAWVRNGLGCGFLVLIVFSSTAFSGFALIVITMSIVVGMVLVYRLRHRLMAMF